MMIPQNLVFMIGYMVVVGGAVLALMWWRIKKRPGKHPLGEDIRLKRQPGEHLRIQMDQIMESFAIRMIVSVFLPFFAFSGSWKILDFWAKPHPVWGLVAAFTCSLAVFGACLRWLFKVTDRLQNVKLGWFGERVVADQLESLKSKGFNVFHDVPCLGGSGPFNLDHVVVGQGIVVVVETKTFRKLKKLKDNHKVSYNGEMLSWPWGQSTRELDQVQRRAAWLKKELKTHLNLDVTVRSALTMPGWYVSGGPPQAPVLVAGYKLLPNFILKRFKPELNDEQTESVARHLNKLCSDLEYERL